VLTAQQRIEVLAGVAREHAWFRTQKDALVQACRPRLEQSDEDLWDTMPAQCIPRSHSVNVSHGCPICGDAINRGYGYYPWLNSAAHPWKVQCPKCLEHFPKNDFLAYYRSGLGEHGDFAEERADRSLLINLEHPDPKDPLHAFGVDPGTGYRDPAGVLYAFVACYNGNGYWGRPFSTRNTTLDALEFAYAYVLTGDRRYARKAAVILSRVATLYPEMDYSLWSVKPEINPSGRLVRGKILDMIWENVLVRRLLRTYDLVHDAVADDEQFVGFLTPRIRHLALPAGTQASPFTRLLEQCYLQEVFRCAQNGRLWGNTGMTEENIALLALATRDPALRDQVSRWLFAPRTITGYDTDQHRQHGGGLLDLVLNLTRDGLSWESGGYCEILPKALMPIYPALPTLLGPAPDPVQQAVTELCRRRLAAYCRNQHALTCLGKFTPYWGDNGTFAAAAYPKGLDPTLHFNGFLLFGDPQCARNAKAILSAGGTGAATAPRIEDLYLLPPDLPARLQAFADAPAESVASAVNLSGRGLVVLKQGDAVEGRCLWTHYGNNHDCHNHPDTLALGLFAFGRDILPRLGYPDLKETSLHTGWHMSAICNNTVVVDGQERMRRIHIADQKLFAESELASVFTIEAASLYEHTTRYERCAGLVSIAADAFYVLDFFAVAGGREHIYSFHSGEGPLHPGPGLAFTPQGTGTYAGSEVPYGDEGYRYSPDYAWRWGNGFQYLDAVERSGPLDESSFTWRLTNTHGVSPFGDRVRCRLNLLTPVTEVATARGRPPQNTVGNPESIPYVLASRRGGEGLASQFVAIVEAYLEDERPLVSVRRLQRTVGGPFSAAVEVTLADGRRDLIVKGPDESAHAVFEGGLTMTGFLCVLRLSPAGDVLEYHASRVREIRLGERFHRRFVPSVRAHVADFERGVAEQSTVVLDQAVSIPENALQPLYADITPTEAKTDASYRILGLRDQEGRTTLHLDTDSFIAAPRDASVFGKTSYAEAFAYAFAEGATVTITLSYHERCGERRLGP
jgi:hypothetical protein